MSNRSAAPRRAGLLPAVLIGLGVFLLVGAVLMRTYAYPTLARVPANYESTTTLEAKGATVFNSDPAVLAPETTDLEITSRTVAGDYPAAPEGVVVWANQVTTRTAEGRVVSQSSELSPFDAVTGEASDYEVGFTEAVAGEREAVVRQGQVYKFPFDTQKKDYLQWDGTANVATTAEYVGEDTVRGIEVYKFVQEVPETVLDTREVPGSIFGVDEPSVEAEVVYSTVRTLWIEPATGSPVHRTDERDQVLRHDGVDVPAFVGTVAYTEESQQKTADKLASQAPMLAGMRGTFPLVAGLLGLLLVAGGALLGRRRPAAPAAPAQQPAATAGV